MKTSAPARQARRLGKARRSRETPRATTPVPAPPLFASRDVAAPWTAPTAHPCTGPGDYTTAPKKTKSFLRFTAVRRASGGPQAGAAARAGFDLRNNPGIRAPLAPYCFQIAHCRTRTSCSRDAMTRAGGKARKTGIVSRRARSRRSAATVERPEQKMIRRSIWCGWRDSNSHALRRSILSALRLPFRHTRMRPA